MGLELSDFPALKRCSKCRKRKLQTAENFYQHPRTKVWDVWCRTCKADDNAARRALAQGREVNWARLERIRSGNPDWKNSELKAAINRRWRLGKHGLTPVSYQALLDAQGGVCASCGSETPDSTGYIKMFPVDHDHACCPGEYSCGKCIRGLLCVACNTAAGVLESARAEQVRAYPERTAGHGLGLAI